MFDSPLDFLSTAGSLAIGLGTGNPILAGALQAAMAGGKTAVQGGGIGDIAQSSAMSGGMSLAGAGAGAVGQEVAGEAGKMVAPMALNAAVGAAQGQSAQDIGLGAAQSAATAGIKGLLNGAPTTPTNPNPTGQNTMSQYKPYARGGRVGYDGGGDIPFDPMSDGYVATMTPERLAQADMAMGMSDTTPSDWKGDLSGWWKDNKSWAAPVGIVGATGALASLGSVLGKSRAPKRPSSAELQQMILAGGRTSTPVMSRSAHCL